MLIDISTIVHTERQRKQYNTTKYRTQIKQNATQVRDKRRNIYRVHSRNSGYIDIQYISWIIDECVGVCVITNDKYSRLVRRTNYESLPSATNRLVIPVEKS